MNTFNLPQNNDTEMINRKYIYGLAYYSGHTGHWMYYVGSFPYLYGIFTARYNMDLHVMEEITHVKVDIAYTFMYINKDYKPVKLINQAELDLGTSVSISGNNENKRILKNLSKPNENVPPMEFKF